MKSKVCHYWKIGIKVKYVTISIGIYCWWFAVLSFWDVKYVDVMIVQVINYPKRKQCICSTYVDYLFDAYLWTQFLYVFLKEVDWKKLESPLLDSSWFNCALPGKIAFLHPPLLGTVNQGPHFVWFRMIIISSKPGYPAISLSWLILSDLYDLALS